MTLRERYIFARALLVSVGGSWWWVLILMVVVVALAVGVVAVVGLDVDRGHVLGFVVVGLYICMTYIFYKKELEELI